MHQVKNSKPISKNLDISKMSRIHLAPESVDDEGYVIDAITGEPIPNGKLDLYHLRVSGQVISYAFNQATIPIIIKKYPQITAAEVNNPNIVTIIESIRPLVQIILAIADSDLAYLQSLRDDQIQQFSNAQWHGKHLLSYAVLAGDLPVLIFLVDKLGPIGADDEGKSAIDWAVITENIPMIKFLSQFTSTLNMYDNNNKTPLDYAETKEIAELLISTGAKITDENIENAKPEFKEFLIVEKIKQVATEDLFKQIRRNDISKMEVAFKNGANPNALVEFLDPNEQSRLLSVAQAIAGLKLDTSSLKALLKMGANPNLPNVNVGFFGKLIPISNPLINAAFQSDAEVVEILVAAGAEPILTYKENKEEIPFLDRWIRTVDIKDPDRDVRRGKIILLLKSLGVEFPAKYQQVVTHYLK